MNTVYIRCWYCVHVFYHHERVLSAIAKFLVYLFGEGEGRVKWERGQVGEKSEERTVCKEGREMKMHEEIDQKTQQILHLGTTLGGYRSM